MRIGSLTTILPAGVAGAFLVLTASFWMDWWGGPAVLAPLPARDTTFASTATVRQSAAELFRTDGDVSMFACYSCHEPDAPPVLQFDEDGHVIVEEHALDFDMEHGRSRRNNTCYNCHAQDDLERLQTRDGRRLGLEESPLLCGSCHGPTYRDWEAGIHGRTNGYWNRQLGPATRQDCTSCHDPHAPAFPSLAPAPGPQPPRPRASRRGPAGAAADGEE